MATSAVIALLTDFGLRTSRVAVLKGALVSANPRANLVDLSHDVAEVRAACAFLKECHPHFPDGTTFVACVGMSRPMIAVETARHRFIAPDNGLLSFLPKSAIRSIHKVEGVAGTKLGAAVKSMKRLDRGSGIAREGVVVGEVLSIERSGALVTNIPMEKLHDVESAEIQVGPSGRKGSPVASNGTLKIKGTAKVGDIVRVSQALSGGADSATSDVVAQIETNLDNVSGEVVGYLFERLFAEGALDVFTTPIQMKKSRPAVLLSVLAPVEKAATLEKIILAESPTFGVRRSTLERRKLDREMVVAKTKYGPIRCKVGRLDGASIRTAPEYEDVRAAATKHRVPLARVQEAARDALRIR